MIFRGVLRDNNRKLKMTDSDMKKVWLHYDIGLAHFCANYKLDSGRNNAIKCCAIGKKNNNIVWELLGNMLKSKLDFKMENYLGARSSVRDALDLARLFGDEDVILFVDEVCPRE